MTIKFAFRPLEQSKRLLNVVKHDILLKNKNDLLYLRK